MTKTKQNTKANILTWLNSCKCVPLHRCRPCRVTSDQKLLQEGKMAFEEYSNRERSEQVAPCCRLWNLMRCVSTFLSLHLLLFEAIKRRGYCPFRWLLFSFTVSFFCFVSLLAVCTVSSRFFRFDWEDVKTEGAFLYRHFSQQTFWLVIAGEAQEQLMTLTMA